MIGLSPLRELGGFTTTSCLIQSFPFERLVFAQGERMLPVNNLFRQATYPLVRQSEKLLFQQSRSSCSKPAGGVQTGKASGILLAGSEACRKAYVQRYRFINIGHIMLQGHLGLTADLKWLRDNAERLTVESAEKAST
jgi:hypothetical protein